MYLTSLWLGLATIQHDTTYLDISTEVPEPLQSLIQEQIKLGWDQLYQGRRLLMWAYVIDLLHPELPINGTLIMVKFQKLIWTYILDTWKLHNAHFHQNASPMDLPSYCQAVIMLYK